MLIKTNTFKTHVITTKDHLNGFGLITIEAHGLRNSSDSICNKITYLKFMVMPASISSKARTQKKAKDNELYL